ncbi:hypothetical protein NFI96_002473 [Prochilodus magdalenae]|nr:hypothetical protein NFI96_002473 [Prochilodus magdalenae]
MPGLYHGFWKMISNENFEDYLKALDVNIAVRKIATLVFCDKDINQNGDHFIIRTFSAFRSYSMEFDIGQEFEEDLKGIDDRKCMEVWLSVIRGLLLTPPPLLIPLLSVEFHMSLSVCVPLDYRDLGRGKAGVCAEGSRKTDEVDELRVLSLMKTKPFGTSNHVKDVLGEVGVSSRDAFMNVHPLDHSMLPTLWGQFGDGPFLFQHDRTPVHRASSIKTWMSESGVEELDWPAQSPDLHPIEHLWDGLGWRLRARPSRPTSVSDLTNVLLEEWSGIPINTFPTLWREFPEESELF